MDNEIILKKLDLLSKLCYMERCGFQLSRNFTMKDNYEMLNEEYRTQMEKKNEKDNIEHKKMHFNSMLKYVFLFHNVKFDKQDMKNKLDEYIEKQKENKSIDIYMTSKNQVDKIIKLVDEIFEFWENKKHEYDIKNIYESNIFDEDIYKKNTNFEFWFVWSFLEKISAQIKIQN